MDSTEQAGAKPSELIGVETATVTDRRGRTIRIRRSNPARRRALYKLIGPENSRNLPLVGEYQMALSVVEIDGEQIPFPAKEAFLEATMDRLGDEGLEAVAQGWRDSGWIDEGRPAEIKN